MHLCSLNAQQFHVGLAVALGGLSALWVYKRRCQMLPVDKKAILITGCDSGIGHALAIQLDKCGFTVFAGCLQSDGSGAETLRLNSSERLRVLQIDITQQDQLDKAVDMVTTELDGQGLWGLVNNAGILYVGDVEMMPTRVIQQMIDVNVMGTVRVTKMFLPLIRRSRGRLVFMASVAGTCPMMRMGVYSASKSAVEMFANTLRLEMSQWGVSVSTLMPAGFKTNITNNVTTDVLTSWYDECNQTVQEDYGLDYFKIDHRKNAIDSAADLRPVTDSIQHALMSHHPHAYYRPGQGAFLLYFIANLLPTPVGDWLLARLTNFFGATPKALQNS